MHSCSNRARLPAPSAFLVAAIVVLMPAGGCYKRVVGVEGVGTDRYDVYEPNLKEPDDSVNPKRQVAPNKTIPSKQAPNQ